MTREELYKTTLIAIEEGYKVAKTKPEIDLPLSYVLKEVIPMVTLMESKIKEQEKENKQ